MPDFGQETPLRLGEMSPKDQLNNGLRMRSRPGAPPPEPHAQMRKKVHDKIQLSNRLAASVPWGITLFIALGIGWGALSYRTEIVRAWPKSATAFAAIGQPANLYGIDIRRVQARRVIDAKGPRVMIGGVLASVSRKPEPVAYLKVSLVDAKGMEKVSWMVDPGINVLQPGTFHAFETSRSTPVRGELKAVIVFAEPPPRTIRPPPPPPEPPAGATGLMGAKAPSNALRSAKDSHSSPTVTGR
jgi:hypothetical protein